MNSDKLDFSRGLRIAMLVMLMALSSACTVIRGTGDLGVVIERTSGSIQIINTTSKKSLGRVTGLGDLSHASVVYSRDERFAYIFGRDGGLSKVDILKQSVVARTMQSGNSIGGAISGDGRLIAVSNYTPGGVKVFDARNLELVADIPATYQDGKLSRVVGLVDAPGQRFVFSLFDAGQIWIADFNNKEKTPSLSKFTQIGRQPYDGLISSDGRYYIAGLFGEPGLALLDLWHTEKGVQRILGHYGEGKKKGPVYKMPHLEGWALTADYAFVPAVGEHAVLVLDRKDWSLIKRIKTHGQPVFVMTNPDQRNVWVNFAVPDNDVLQVIDTQKLQVVKQIKAGKGVLHMEFTPRGEDIWVSVRDEDRVKIYDARNYELKRQIKMNHPSGIFMTYRAHRIGL